VTRRSHMLGSHPDRLIERPAPGRHTAVRPKAFATGRVDSRERATSRGRVRVLTTRSLLCVALSGFGIEWSNVAGAEPKYFATLEPGSPLPSGAVCANKVRRSPWEPRPQNQQANHSRGITGVKVDGANALFNATYAQRIDGAFPGTTDEIIQWASCKWGFDENITRARAVAESRWHQSQRGDRTNDPRACAIIGKRAPCWQSYGILQVKGTVHKGTYPAARDSTAFNLDYSLAWLRACYEAAFSHWLGKSYRAGDEWGCVGAWFSGDWHDSAAEEYIQSVKDHLAGRVWNRIDF
jgi:hypothetical protein